MSEPSSSKSVASRRRFLTSSGVSLAALELAGQTSQSLFAQSEKADTPQRVVVGVMGLSRGLSLASDLAKMPSVEVKYLCDVDTKRAATGVTTIEKLGGKPMVIGDFRKMLDDQELDALFCAAPNHWHGPAAIMGCKAGKHVYVEKPACHNPQEGEWMVEAAVKYQRCVQVGTQRRSSPGIQAAIAKLHDGAIGRVYLARAFFNRFRGSIGVKPESTPPENLNFDLWQGPAPRRPFHENIVPYNWHWFWHWGNGELGNNGIHVLDLCRWAMKVDFPIRTVSSGGRYGFEDDQETPDNQQVAWEFGDNKQITYQGTSLSKTEMGPFASFYGTDGYLALGSDGSYQIFDAQNKLVEEAEKTSQGQPEHISNFIESIRADDPSKLAQPIQSGYRSTMLCLLGNIAQRTDRVIHSRADDGHITDEGIPAGLWRREYDPKWEEAVTKI